MSDLGEIREIGGRRILVLIDKEGEECCFWCQDGALRFVWSGASWGVTGGRELLNFVVMRCGTTLAAIRARLEAVNA